MPYLLSILIGALVAIGAFVAQPVDKQTFGDALRVFTSAQVGTTPTNGYVLQTNGSISSWVATSTLGISSSAGFGQAWELITNVFSQSALAPTTTQNIHVSGTGTSTIVGGLEAWRLISAPYFNATSTATSSFAGSIDMGLNNHLTVHGIRSDASDGIHFHANNWTNVALFGAGNTANTLFYGGVNIDGATRLATSLTGALSASSGSVSAGTLTVANGGTGISSYTAGDIIYASAPTTLAKVASSTNGFLLALENGIPSWVASTTLSTISGTLSAAKGGTGQDSSGWTGLTLTTGGTWSQYAGTSCTNQFVRSLSVSGAATCASINNGDWSGTDLSVANGGTGLSTFGGTDTILYTTSADTLAFEAGFEYSATGNRLTVSNASTTNLSIATRLWIPSSANPTISINGDLAIDTTTASTSLRYYDGSAERAVYDIKSKSFLVASSTLTYNGAFGAAGTTTLLLWNPLHPVTVVSVFCKSDTGTAKMNVNDGTNLSTMANCSATPALTTISTNNTFVMSEDFKVDIGTSASTPNRFTITINYRETLE